MASDRTIRIEVTFDHARVQYCARAEYDRRGCVAELQVPGRSRKQAITRAIARFRKNGHAGRPWQATGDVIMRGTIPEPRRQS